MKKDEFNAILSQKFGSLWEQNRFFLFEKYYSFLLENNKKFNLTRLIDDSKIYQNYFLESLLPFANMDLNHLKILDIGSGSGIPGIALKIVFPQMKLTIIEANAKKIKFMQMLVDHLGFQDVTFYHQRAEQIQSEQKQQFDIVTSRAVASLEILLEISSPYTKLNGLIIEPKSIKYQQELTKAYRLLNDLGLELKNIENYQTDKQNYVLYFKKIKECAKIYPRSWKEIIKNK